MKKFVTNTLWFIFPAFILAYPLDLFMSYYLSQTHEYPGEYEVWNDIYNSDANCDIAIYGSSRAWVHIDPKIISDSLGLKAYNFGIDGHSFWLQYLRYLEHLKYNEEPSTIILSVGLETLQKGGELYQLDQFLPYMLWNSNIQEYTSSYIGYSILDYYLPLVRYSGKTSASNLIKQNIVKGKGTNSYRQNGFLGMDREWNSDIEKAKTQLKSLRTKMDANCILLFDKFINECKANNIELILVYTPEYIDYQKVWENRDDVVKIYKDFSMKYAVDFIDYSNDSICLDKTYFYNGSHLNSLGADVFSKKLACDLKARNR